MKNFSKIILILLTISCVAVTVTMVSEYSIYQQWALCATGIFYVLDYVLQQRWRSFQWEKKDWVMVAMIGFYVLLLLRNGLDGFRTNHLFSHQVELMAPFFILPIIGLLGLRYALSKRLIAYTTVLTCIGGIIATLVLCAIKAPLPEYIWVYSPLSYYHAQMHQYIGSHMSIDLYMNIALLFGLYMIEKSQKKSERIFFGITSVLIAVQTGLSDGRSGMLATLLIISVFALHLGWQRFRYKTLLSILLCGACVYGAVAVNGRFHLPSQISEAESATPDPRLSLWKYTYQMIKEHPIIGHGYQTLEEDYIVGAFADAEVKKNYIDHMDQLGLLTFDTIAEVHPHNTFLLLWLEAGILAPLALILIFVLACWFTKKENRLYVILFSLVILWQAMFDSFCSVFQPTVVCWFLLIWLYANHERTEVA